MKKASALFVGLVLLLLCSCNVADLLGGGSDSQVSFYKHTIASSDEDYDSSAGNYRITIANSKFTGTYWAELWIVNSDGYMTKAAPYNISGTWYLKIANLAGSVRFRSDASMVGKEIYIFYSPASAL